MLGQKKLKDITIFSQEVSDGPCPTSMSVHVIETNVQEQCIHCLCCPVIIE